MQVDVPLGFPMRIRNRLAHDRWVGNGSVLECDPLVEPRKSRRLSVCRRAIDPLNRCKALLRHGRPVWRRLPWPLVGSAEIRLLNGDAFTVDGTVEEVEKRLSDAARSGKSRLAWFTEVGTDAPLGVNPDHVATLRANEASG